MSADHPSPLRFPDRASRSMKDWEREKPADVQCIRVGMRSTRLSDLPKAHEGRGAFHVPHPRSLSRSGSWKGAVAPGEGGPGARGLEMDYGARPCP
jgi:hypothetical protein